MGFKSLLCSLALTAVFFPQISFGQTQTNSYAFITWQANNYYPADFSGKALATNGTTVNASVNLVESQKIQDLSQATITWYLDGSFFKQGTGLNQVNFTVTKTRGDNHSIRADVQTKNGLLSPSVSIPITSPKVVVVNPYSSQTISKTSQINLEAIPYFFNVKSFGNLIFSWIVGDKAQPSGNDNKLSLTMDPTSQGVVSIIGRVDNGTNKFESAEGKTSLTLSQ